MSHVARACGVSPKGLGCYIGRHHREMLLARYGLDAGSPEQHGVKVKAPQGQSLISHLKYKEAIEAAGDMAFIDLNVAQVARLFGLDGPALAAQLRVHYPDVIPMREGVRQRLGIADNTPRGARRQSKEMYAEAVALYRDTDLTLSEAARVCGVSESGFCQHLRFYHKDVMEQKRGRREMEAALKRNSTRQPVGAGAERKRRCRVSEAAAAKYAAAIESLRESPREVSAVAAQFGLNADVFRQYLRAHEPELASGQGMTTLANGRTVRKTSSQRYAAAVEEYAAGAEPLTAIARRHGIPYATLAGFIKRNCPEAKESHELRVQNAQ